MLGERDSEVAIYVEDREMVGKLQCAYVCMFNGSSFSFRLMVKWTETTFLWENFPIPWDVTFSSKQRHLLRALICNSYKQDTI